jgi:hypothetical protein
MANRRTDLDFYVENLIKEFPVYAALRQRLLQIGGNEISIGNEDIQKRRRSKVEQQQAAWLAANGKESDGEADLWKGLPGECYANVAMLFFLSRQLEVWSGWALAPDYHLTDSGIWTEHCWGRYQGRLIETTGRRKNYFGDRAARPASAEKWARETLGSKNLYSSDPLDYVVHFPETDVGSYLGIWRE